jgi:hypothetical protein
MPDFDFWEKELPVIRDAPHLFFGGIIATILFVVPLTWFVVNWGYGQRLKLADDRARWDKDVKDEIIRQFREFKEAEASRAGNDALIARIERLEAAVLSVVTGVLNVTEGVDNEDAP